MPQNTNYLCALQTKYRSIVNRIYRRKQTNSTTTTTTTTTDHMVVYKVSKETKNSIKNENTLNSLWEMSEKNLKLANSIGDTRRTNKKSLKQRKQKRSDTTNKNNSDRRRRQTYNMHKNGIECSITCQLRIDNFPLFVSSLLPCVAPFVFLRSMHWYFVFVYANTWALNEFMIKWKLSERTRKTAHSNCNMRCNMKMALMRYEMGVEIKII